MKNTLVTITNVITTGIIVGSDMNIAFNGSFSQEQMGVTDYCDGIYIYIIFTLCKTYFG